MCPAMCPAEILLLIFAKNTILCVFSSSAHLPSREPIKYSFVALLANYLPLLLSCCKSYYALHHVQHITVYKHVEPKARGLVDGSPQYNCRKCTTNRQQTGMWLCRNRHCRLQKPKGEFSFALERHGGNSKDNSRKCNDCI